MIVARHTCKRKGSIAGSFASGRRSSRTPRPAANAVLRRYSWQSGDVGLDVPLSVYDMAANTSYCYTTDANKNISEIAQMEERQKNI